MATTQEVLDKAKELGDLIAEHDAAKKLDAAVKALDADRDAQRAITDLERHAQSLAKKEQGGQPIEVEDKRKMQALQNAVVKNPTLRDFQVAQMDVLDLLRKVDENVTPKVLGGGM